MLSAGQPSPPGIPSRADQVAIFEEALGRPVQKLDYYGVLAALRMALVIAQTIRHLAVDGLLPSTNRADIANRSEEHTSELQSLMRISYAVFCLKKKTKN